MTTYHVPVTAEEVDGAQFGLPGLVCVDVVLEIDATPSCPGDRWTPPTPAVLEVVGCVTRPTVTLAGLVGEMPCVDWTAWACDYFASPDWAEHIRERVVEQDESIP